MSKKDKVIFSRKEFLNIDGMNNMANIVAYIKVYHWREETEDILENRDLDIVLCLADCERKVSFSIQLDSEEERENALFKVDNMLSVLTDFREAIVKESAIQEERDKLLAKQKADKKAKEEAEKKEQEVLNEGTDKEQG